MRHPVQSFFVFLLLLIFGPYLLAAAVLVAVLYLAAWAFAGLLHLAGATK